MTELCTIEKHVARSQLMRMASGYQLNLACVLKFADGAQSLALRLAFVCAFLSSVPLYAQSLESSNSKLSPELTLEAQRKEREAHALAQLMTQVIALTAGPTDRERENGSVRISNQGPFAVQGRRTIDSALMASGSWELVRSWLRVYYQTLYSDLKEQSEDPLASDERKQQLALLLKDVSTPLAEDQFVQLIETEAARGGFVGAIKDRTDATLKKVLGDAADLGARHGRAIFIAKVTAEAAEEILTFMTFNVGVHVLCQAIDVALVFVVRRLQSIARGFTYQWRFDESGLSQSVKRYFVAKSVSKAMRSIRIEVRPFELNESELNELDQFGPKRWWGWVETGKRAAFIKWLERKLTSKPIERSGLITEDPKEIDRSGFQTVIHRDQFFGTRFARWGYVISRKWSRRYLVGQDQLSRDAKRFQIWPIVLEESVLRPALSPLNLGTNPHTESLLTPDRMRTEALRSRLSAYAEFELGRRAALSSQRTPRSNGKSSTQSSAQLADPLTTAESHQTEVYLLQDLQTIFDAKISTDVRYAIARSFEDVLGVWAYRHFQNKLIQESGGRLGAVLKARYRLAQPQKFVFELSDFLKVAALSKDEVELKSAQIQSERFLIDLIEGLRQSRTLTVQSFHPTDAEALKKSMDHLESIRPWGRRDRFQFFGRAPRCENL